MRDVSISKVYLYNLIAKISSILMKYRCAGNFRTNHSFKHGNNNQCNLEVKHGICFMQIVSQQQRKVFTSAILAY